MTATMERGATMEPMLAVVAPPHMVSEVAGSDAWVFEPKIDGDRRVVIVEDGVVSGLNRSGGPAVVPASVAAECDLLVRTGTDCVLDGELVDDTWVVFDLLCLRGVSLLKTPYWSRRATLESIFEQWAPGAAVQLVTVARTLDDKLDLIARVREQRAEGIVAKNVTSRYYPGKRVPSWLKLKFTKTVDCVVMSFGTDKQNMQLGVYLPGQPKPYQCGEVSRLTGDGPAVAVTGALREWMLMLGHDVDRLVVEVTVLYCSPNFKLVQPVTPRFRDDKRPDECTFDQLPPLIPLEPVI